MDYKLPERKTVSNKSTYGRVLNIAGSDYMTGAAYLSSVSALKIGCGYCFLCSTEKVIQAVAAQTQNVVFVPTKNLEKEIEKADVIEIGCGLSQSGNAIDLFERTIKKASQTQILIIDADGLNILSNNQTYFDKNFSNVILTPHPKEAARLLNCNTEDILNDTQKASAKISEKYNCIAVLKTHKTVVTDKNGKTYVNDTGNNALAKAGSGDVLAGMIAGLAAQKTDLFESACLGVYLHGLCADLAIQKLSPYSVMAQDLIDYIPCAIKSYIS